MPEQQITNAAGVWGVAADLGVRTIPMVNGASAAVIAGSVVALSTNAAGEKQFGITLTGADPLVLGVVKEDAAVGEIAQVVVGGFTLIAVSTSAIPARGNLLVTSTGVLPTSSQAGIVKASSAGTPVGSVIGIALSSSLDATSSSSVGSYIPAYINKM